jgi:hypothetical protein
MKEQSPSTVNDIPCFFLIVSKWIKRVFCSLTPGSVLGQEFNTSVQNTSSKGSY